MKKVLILLGLSIVLATPTFAASPGHGGGPRAGGGSPGPSHQMMRAPNHSIGGGHHPIGPHGMMPPFHGYRYNFGWNPYYYTPYYSYNYYSYPMPYYYPPSVVVPPNAYEFYAADPYATINTTANIINTAANVAGTIHYITRY